MEDPPSHPEVSLFRPETRPQALRTRSQETCSGLPSYRILPPVVRGPGELHLQHKPQLGCGWGTLERGEMLTPAKGSSSHPRMCWGNTRAGRNRQLRVPVSSLLTGKLGSKGQFHAETLSRLQSAWSPGLLWGESPHSQGQPERQLPSTENFPGLRVPWRCVWGAMMWGQGGES